MLKEREIRCINFAGGRLCKGIALFSASSVYHGGGGRRGRGECMKAEENFLLSGKFDWYVHVMSCFTLQLSELLH